MGISHPFPAQVSKKYGFIVPLEGGVDEFLHVRDVDGDAATLRIGDVVTYVLVPYNKRTKATKVARATPASYAAVVFADEGRTLSALDARAEMSTLKDAPLPPKQECDPL